MFSFLDIVNHYLGYFNINTTVKSRIYTLLGLLGDGYLFYVAIRFFQNGYFSRGALFLIVAVGLLYFAIGNLFYYFTKRQFKFDISPWLSRKLHIAPKPQPEVAEMQRVRAVNMPANGLFDEQHVLPAKLTVSDTDKRNLNTLVTQLMQMGLLKPDYEGRSDRKITEMLRHNGGKPVYAIGLGVMLPYFEMHHEGGQYVIYGGINQAEVVRLGSVHQVGLQSISAADQLAVDFYLASVTVVGGPFKLKGRSEIIEHPAEYDVAVRVAYKKTE